MQDEDGGMLNEDEDMLNEDGDINLSICKGVYEDDSQHAESDGGLSFGNDDDDDDSNKIVTNKQRTTSEPVTSTPIDTPDPDASPAGSIFLKPPIQRQKWGEDYVLPHVNWGDLFFDLFYVGVAYNLSGIIKGGISGGGDELAVALLYFFGCFGTVYSCFWQGKILFDSRFEVPSDVVHWTMEIMFLCWLAMATVHIRPVSVMSINGPGENQEMFSFCLANLLGTLVYMLLSFEVGFVWVKGQETVAKFQAKTDLIEFTLNFSITMAATIYSGRKYFWGESGGGQDHVAIWILLVGWLVTPITQFLAHWYRGMYAKDVDFKQFSVPMNVDFMIHRYGEWTMLMLGESILSLVIVEVADKSESSYYLTFYFGVVSVIMLQLLYFKSQPHAKEHHAFRRSRGAGLLFAFMNQFYSAALILVGVSYKLLLLEYQSGAASYKLRFLGDYESSSAIVTSDKRQNIAKLFCYGLSAVYVTLDIMNLAHTGISASIGRCYAEDKKHLRVKGIILVVLSRYCIVATVMVCGYYIYEDPVFVAMVGNMSVLLQVFIRYLGKRYFREDAIVYSSAVIGGGLGSREESNRGIIALSIGSQHKILTGLNFWGFSLILPPIQRQKWGDNYCRPHVNWGDLFFDLFYVGAAYNLGTIIKYDIKDPGLALLYFFGIFGTILNCFWSKKMLFDARFSLPEDLCHRTVEILHLCLLAMATQHIRPIKYMGNCGDYPEMFLFCLANLLGSLVYTLLNAEIGFGWVVGQKAATFNARTEVFHHCLCMAFQLAATIYSGLGYFGAIDVEGKQDHTPMWILFAGWLCVIPLLYFTHWSRGLWEKEVDFRSFTVPMNIHFVIHRNGEWTMLMLGESVLSLVIVDGIARINDGKYYLTFFLGVLNVIFLQFLYFKSQPHDIAHHAMRRSRHAGLSYNFMIQIYSAALIIVGVSYKLLLTEYTIKYAYDGARTLASEEGYLSNTERRKYISNFFCYGLAGTFVTLDFINLAHSGISATLHKCVFESRKLAAKALTLVVLTRCCIVIGVMVISQFISEDPQYIALLGFISVALQVGIRFLQNLYFQAKSDHTPAHEEQSSISDADPDFGSNREMNISELPEITDITDTLRGRGTNFDGNSSSDAGV